MAYVPDMYTPSGEYIPKSQRGKKPLPPPKTLEKPSKAAKSLQAAKSLSDWALAGAAEAVAGAKQYKKYATKFEKFGLLQDAKNIRSMARAERKHARLLKMMGEELEIIVTKSIGA